MNSQEEYSFALCLSHDVDRVYKTYQYFYNLLTNNDLYEMTRFFSAKNPYWQFNRIMSIESELGVRSSFNILDEIPIRDRPKSDWLTKSGWMLYGGRYDITDPQVSAMLSYLEDAGWEIALQGSYTSSENPDRFEYEKNRIESVAGTEIIGNRQHHWKLSRPDTWKHLRRAGIKYDTSIGSSDEFQFQNEHELVRPFGDEFIVFPWSLMDGAVMGSAEETSEVWSNVKSVLREVRDERSVLVADWHQRVFFDSEFPDWAEIYRKLIVEALDMGAWVGPPQRFYEATTHPNGTISETLENLARSDG